MKKEILDPVRITQFGENDFRIQQQFETQVRYYAGFWKGYRFKNFINWYTWQHPKPRPLYSNLTGPIIFTTAEEAEMYANKKIADSIAYPKIIKTIW